MGVAAAFFAAACGATLVHSFEPVPPLFELLRVNVAPYQACVAHPFGLSSKAGKADITFYRGAAAMSGLYADPDADRELVRRCMLNLGLSEEQAEKELDGRYEPTTMECELRTLSDVLARESLDAVDLLKIDVEKAELDVLRGIEAPDWRRIRQVVVEVHDEAGRLAAIVAMLEQHGFMTTTAQDPIMRGTAVWLVYARRR